MHKKENQEKKNLRVFGCGFGLIFLFVGIRLWVKHGFGIDKAVWLGLGGLWLLVTTARYEWLIPVYRRWMRITGRIGTVITAVVLAVLFYGVFGPIGIVFRLVGRDLLDQGIERERLTYWVKRQSDQRGEEKYRQQF